MSWNLHSIAAKLKTLAQIWSEVGAQGWPGDRSESIWDNGASRDMNLHQISCMEPFCPHQLQLFMKMLRCYFAVKLQKCFVDFTHTWLSIGMRVSSWWINIRTCQHTRLVISPVNLLVSQWWTLNRSVSVSWGIGDRIIIALFYQFSSINLTVSFKTKIKIHSSHILTLTLFICVGSHGAGAGWVDVFPV